jgi:diguanylate cyclase (GGDEF)-like protein
MDTEPVVQDFFGKQYARLGFDNVQLKVGSYVLYISKNKSAIAPKLSDLIAQGFSDNEKCIFAGSPQAEADIAKLCKKQGRPLDANIKFGQYLTITNIQDLLKKSKFSLEAFFGQVQMYIDDTCLQGWSSLRMIVDISWLFESVGKGKAITERELELFRHFTSKRNFLLFVGYISGTQLTPKNMVDILNCHPFVLVDDNFLNRTPGLSMNVDNLTGLFNDIHFQEILKKELARCTRYSRPCTVIVFDIDDFKHINRQYGYNKGDDLLTKASELFMTNIRNVDILGRTGGGEFSVLLPETDKQGAYLMGQRILKIVRENIRMDELPITVSAGYAGFPEDSKSPIELIKKAKEALKKAQMKGRDSVLSAEDSLTVI